MKLQLARKLLAIVSLLLAIVIIWAGINSAYIADSQPDEPWTGHAFFAFFVVASVVPFLGSYILWPK